MKRLSAGVLAFGVVCLAGAAPRADVKTQEKARVTFGGMLGRMAGMFGGKSAKDGVVSTVAVKGDRKMTVTDTSGRIIDLAEEKIYDLDLKKKTYTITTFAELRRQMEEARKKAEEQVKEAREDAPETEADTREMEIDFDAKETGNTKSIAGHDAREVMVTVTVREKGKTLDEAGGMVLTTDAWLADVPEVAEIREFDRRYFEKLAGPVAAGASAEQMAAAMAMYPGMKAAIERMQQESVKLDGTPLASTMTMEAVRNPEQAAQDKSAPESGGGLGGMLARRMMRKTADEGGRSKVMTTEHQVLSIAAAVADGDVSIPAGFKEKT